MPNSLILKFVSNFLETALHLRHSLSGDKSIQCFDGLFLCYLMTEWFTLLRLVAYPLRCLFHLKKANRCDIKYFFNILKLFSGIFLCLLRPVIQSGAIYANSADPGNEVMKRFSCSTQLCMKF